MGLWYKNPRNCESAFVHSKASLDGVVTDRPVDTLSRATVTQLKASNQELTSFHRKLPRKCFFLKSLLMLLESPCKETMDQSMGDAYHAVDNFSND